MGPPQSTFFESVNRGVLGSKAFSSGASGAPGFWLGGSSGGSVLLVNPETPFQAHGGLSSTGSFELGKGTRPPRQGSNLNQ